MQYSSKYHPYSSRANSFKSQTSRSPGQAYSLRIAVASFSPVAVFA